MGEVACDSCGRFNNLFMWILPLCSTLQGPPVPGKLKENMYNHDGGLPLRIIIQQLQEEAKYLTVLTLPAAEAPLEHRKSLLVQSLPFVSDLLLTVFFCCSPWIGGVQG